MHPERQNEQARDDDTPVGERPRAWRAQRAAAPTLPLEAQIRPGESGGWAIWLPVREEQVVFDKQVVVTERVTVRRGEVADVVRVHDTVAREELRIDTTGDVRMADERGEGGWG
jgi:stress response protein YsnF